MHKPAPSDEAFGTLRGLAHSPRRDEVWRARLWRLLCDAHAQAPDTLRRVWHPYLRDIWAARDHRAPLALAQHQDELARFIEIAPFATFAFATTFDQTRPARWTDEGIPEASRAHISSLFLLGAGDHAGLFDSITDPDPARRPPLDALHIGGLELPADTLNAYLQHDAAQTLRTLAIVGRCGRDETLLALAASPTRANLETLRLTPYYTEPGSLRALMHTSALPALRALTLTLTEGPEDHAALIDAPLLASLQHLTLTAGYLRPNSATIEAALTTPSLRDLRTLRLQNIALTDSGRRLLRDLAPRSLTDLALDGIRMERDALRRLIPHIPASVQRLSLAGYRKMGQSLTPILTAPNLRNLRALDLTASVSDDEDLLSAATCDALPRLTELSLAASCAQLTPNTLARLLNAPWAATLEQLDLSGNRFCDEHAEVLASCTNLRRLRTLLIHNHHLTPRGVAHLARTPQPLTTLGMSNASNFNTDTSGQHDQEALTEAVRDTPALMALPLLTLPNEESRSSVRLRDRVWSLSGLTTHDHHFAPLLPAC